MKPKSIFTTATNNDRVRNRNLAIADRDRSAAQLTPPKQPLASRWVGLGSAIIIASIAPTAVGQQTSAPVDVCIAQNPKQEAQAALARSQAQLVQANTNLQKFQSDRNRYQTLAAQGRITRKQLKRATAAHDLAQLQKRSALKGLQQAQAQLAAVRVSDC